MRRRLEAVWDRFRKGKPDLVLIVTGYFQILGEARNHDLVSAS
jgi:hypothetical protein